MIILGDEQTLLNERFLIGLVKKYGELFNLFSLPTLISSSLKKSLKIFPHSIIKVINNEKILIPYISSEKDTYIDMFKKLKNKGYGEYLVPTIAAIGFAEWFDFIELFHSLEPEFIQLNVILPYYLGGLSHFIDNFSGFIAELREITNIKFLIKLPFEALFSNKLAKILSYGRGIFTCYNISFSGSESKVITFKLRPEYTDLFLSFLKKANLNNIGISADIRDLKQLHRMLKLNVDTISIPYVSRSIIGVLKDLNKAEHVEASSIIKLNLSNAKELKLIVDRDKCDKCMGEYLCINFCPFEAISLRNSYPFIDNVSCTKCYVCLNICPRDAISREYKVHISVSD
ncbi:MAG: hypothetical protein B6U94_04780 [Thermofilum sp. ex4484_79]|nr:MAG: hypothetical protein B6U94_04780 [Thermofilum sp. ex4484_79]